MKTLYWLLAASCLFLDARVGSADIIFSHVGNSDPTTENWSVDASGLPEGPITGDMGFDAWSIVDNDFTNHTGYRGSLTAGQTAAASIHGWILRTRLRIVDTSDTAAGSIFVDFGDGSTRYSMAFGSDADGDPTAVLWDGTKTGIPFNGDAFTLEGVGSTYHLWELVYDPQSASADLFVDGTEVLSNYTGHTNIIDAGGFDDVRWGAHDSTDMGEGRYNLVQLEIVPEPSSALFVAGAMLTFGFVRRRRSRVDCCM